MGNDNNKNEALKKIGEKANKESPNSFINSSIIKLSCQTIIGENKTDPEQDYKKLKPLGEGFFSTVYEVQNRITDIMRAMKVIKKTQK